MTVDRVFRTALILAAAAAFAVWFGVRPLHTRAGLLEADVDDLRERIAESSVPEARLDAARTERDRRRSMLAIEGFDRMPAGIPDVAGVIRRLSLPIDGLRVLDQTFTAGRAGAAASGAPPKSTKLSSTMWDPLTALGDDDDDDDDDSEDGEAA